MYIIDMQETSICDVKFSICGQKMRVCCYVIYQYTIFKSESNANN